MGRNKSEFLSAFGTVFEIWKRIVEAVRELGGDDEDMRHLLTDSMLVKEIAKLIIVGRVKAHYKVVVDYGKTLTEMIRAGKYDYVNDDISDKHFPIQGSGQHEAELVLVHLNKDATTKEVMANLDGMGLKPAKIEHQLALGASRPELQKEFPIVALGSVWVDDNGSRSYPCLRCDGDVRGLDLYWDWDDDDSRWSGHCRFLALRK
ncbi:hypothetical protein JW977_03215 [Candidatus Falkowbacteria bacterium]|nr:hypothetical protein [Candidatus Falkowbacteria bacterium]